MSDLSTWLLWLGCAYLAGSVPFGLVIGLARGVDIRNQGSGNVGATNAGRVLGRVWGVVCFLLDVAKGFVPVLAYGLVAGPAADEGNEHPLAVLRWLSIGVAAVLGHIFPIWLRFKGGKGVATSLGAMLGVWPVLTIPGLGGGLVWFGLAKWTGYASAASITTALAMPILVAVNLMTLDRSGGQFAVYLTVTSVLVLLVVVRHRSNILHLRAGREEKIAWASGKAPTSPRAIDDPQS